MNKTLRCCRLSHSLSSCRLRPLGVVALTAWLPSALCVSISVRLLSQCRCCELIRLQRPLPSLAPAHNQSKCSQARRHAPAATPDHREGNGSVTATTLGLKIQHAKMPHQQRHPPLQAGQHQVKGLDAATRQLKGASLCPNVPLRRCAAATEVVQRYVFLRGVRRRRVKERRGEGSESEFGQEISLKAAIKVLMRLTGRCRSGGAEGPSSASPAWSWQTRQMFPRFTPKEFKGSVLCSIASLQSLKTAFLLRVSCF